MCCLAVEFGRGRQQLQLPHAHAAAKLGLDFQGHALFGYAVLRGRRAAEMSNEAELCVVWLWNLEEGGSSCSCHTPTQLRN